MQELDPCRRLIILKLEGTRSLGKPKLRWLESVEEDLKKMGVENWRLKWQNREQWGQFWKRLRFTENCNAK